MGRESVQGFLKNNYLLLLIFLAGLSLRIYDLGTESVWYDEVRTIMVSRLGFMDLIKWLLAHSREGNPPFYYMFFHLWIPVFGDSEFSSRFPSVIFGSLSILAIYAVGKLLFNKRAGLIAALILATSVFHINYSQEARGYSLIVLLTLISFYAFLKLTSGGKRAYGIAYVVSSIVLIITHYYGLLIVAAQNIFCFTLFLKNKKAGELGPGRWIRLQMILAFLLLPGIFLLARIILSIIKDGVWASWVPEPTPFRMLIFFITYSGSPYLLYLFASFSFLSVLSFGKINRTRKLKDFFKPLSERPDNLGITSGNIIYLLLLWLLIPIIIPYVVSLVLSPVLVFRYTIIASPALYLLASKGISNTNKKWIILLASAVIAVLSLVNVGGYYARVDKYQWREVISDIEANAGNGDVIVVYPYYEEGPAEYYLRRKDLKIIPMKGRFPSLQGLGNRGLWIIFHAHPTNRRLFKEGLGGSYDFIGGWHYTRLDLLLFKGKRE